LPKIINIIATNSSFIIVYMGETIKKREY